MTCTSRAQIFSLSVGEITHLLQVPMRTDRKSLALTCTLNIWVIPGRIRGVLWAAFDPRSSKTFNLGRQYRSGSSSAANNNNNNNKKNNHLTTAAPLPHSCCCHDSSHLQWRMLWKVSSCSFSFSSSSFSFSSSFSLSWDPLQGHFAGWGHLFYSSLFSDVKNKFSIPLSVTMSKTAFAHFCVFIGWWQWVWDVRVILPVLPHSRTDSSIWTAKTCCWIWELQQLSNPGKCTVEICWCWWGLVCKIQSMMMEPVDQPTHSLFSNKQVKTKYFKAISAVHFFSHCISFLTRRRCEPGLSPS